MILERAEVISKSGSSKEVGIIKGESDKLQEIRLVFLRRKVDEN